MTKTQYYARLDAIKLAIDSSIMIVQSPIVTQDGSLMDEAYRVTDSNIKLANISMMKAQRALHEILDIETIEFTEENDND